MDADKTADVEAEASWEQALAWRMSRQHLVDRASATDVVAVVERMCGLHAQVMSSVELALAARIDGLTRAAVQEALWQQRTLVKLWAMRGTLHVLPAADLGLWLGGLSTYATGWPMYGMADPIRLELADLVGRVLRDNVLTRAELAAAVGTLSGSAETGALVHGSWGGFLKPASFLGQLCFGPGDGQRVRFANPHTWLPARPVPVDADHALAEIARRFLSAHGPAGPVDLAAWFGVNKALVQPVLAALGDAATQVRIDGRTYWMLADDLPDLQATAPTNVVRLLPGFDQWVVCATRRDGGRARPGPGEPALDPAYRKRIYRMQGWVSPVVLVNGRMAGVWRHERRGRQIRIEVEPFCRLPRWTRQPIKDESDRIVAFLSGEPTSAAGH
jgi:Winged helix DNA-binding domain